MKIIYDSERPSEKRLELVGADGESYFGFHCFRIWLDDGEEMVKVGRWGNARERDAIIKSLAGKKAKGEEGEGE